MNPFKKIARFEMHHQILFFSALLIGTIVLIRIGVQFYNPNPVFFGFELHHFDYGVIFLLFTAKLLLFGSPRFKPLYLICVAIASALIIDGYMALRLSVTENQSSALQHYNDTIGSVVIAVTTTVLALLFVRALLKKKKTMATRTR